MAKQDPRVDAYIAKSAEFAKPILNHIRRVVHLAAPQIEETLKWSMPHFVYKGTVCSMAAFKEHCGLSFWKSALVLGDKNESGAGMGQFGKITSIADLPPEKELIAHIKKAVELNEEGIKPPRRAPAPREELVVPEDLIAELKKNKKALTAFENFSYSHKKEYVKWVVEAKREETRRKRIVATAERLASGKSRNWEYERC